MIRKHQIKPRGRDFVDDAVSLTDAKGWGLDSQKLVDKLYPD
jgi:hypothetical protein